MDRLAASFSACACFYLAFRDCQQLVAGYGQAAQLSVKC